MIISSELTGERYDSVEECLRAEEEYAYQQELKKVKEKQKEKEIEQAEQDAISAFERYRKLLGIDDDKYQSLLIEFVMDILFEREEEEDTDE